MATWRETHRGYTTVWNRANPEKCYEYNRNYRTHHPEQARKRLRDWQRTHPEMVRVYNFRRRALRNEAAGSCDVTQLQARIDFYGGRCWVPDCGKLYEAIDHVIPLSKGGSNWPANLRPICQHHNSRKYNKNWREVVRAAA